MYGQGREEKERDLEMGKELLLVGSRISVSHVCLPRLVFPRNASGPCYVRQVNKL